MKKLFRGVLCALLLAAIFPVAAHDGHAVESSDETTSGKHSDANITGHVVDARTGEHIAYATLALKGTTIGAATDATGHFFLKNLPTGRFTLVASAVGYAPAEREVELRADRTIEVNFELHEAALAVDEVVVSASRTETNKRFSPTIVSVASQKLFENTASCNLAESMNFQSGLRVENNCGNCGTTQLRINGLDGQYSQVLLDSRPIFSSLAGMYGLELFPASMIERVEVIRGGGSALFGSSAIGGVVNIITREPLRNSVALGNTTNILEGGSADFNTSLNGSFVSDDYRTGIYLFGMVRSRDSYDRNDDGFSDIPKLNSETAGFRAYYKTSAYTRLTAEYHHIHEFRRGGNAFNQPPHMADIAEQLDHKIDGGGLKFDWFAPDDRHRLGIYLSAQHIDRDSYFGTEQNPTAYGGTNDMTVVAGAQYTYAFERLLFLPSDLTAGIEYNYNTLHDEYLGFGRDLRQTTHTTGFFFQNEWKSEKVNFLIGGRLDKHNLMRRVVFSPRANVRYSPIPQVGLRLSYSSGFRAPQAYNEDLHIDALDNKMVLIRLSPDLRPEYSHSLSASVDLYRTFGRVQTNLLIEGFYTMLDDVFTLEKVGEDSQGNVIKERRNASGATVAGIGAEFKAGIPGRFELQAGYTFQAQPLRRALPLVGRRGAAAPHVPLARPLRLPDGRLVPAAQPDRHAVRHLHGPHARTAQCRGHRARCRDADSRLLGHGLPSGLFVPTHGPAAPRTECRREESLRQLPARPRLRSGEGLGLHLRTFAAADLFRRGEIRALSIPPESRWTAPFRSRSTGSCGTPKGSAPCGS